MASCWQIMTPSSFFQLIVDLKQSRTRISGTWSIISTFLFIATFYFTKTENRIRKSVTQLSYYPIKKRFYFYQECWFFAKNADISGYRGYTPSQTQNKPIKSPRRLGLNNWWTVKIVSFQLSCFKCFQLKNELYIILRRRTENCL